MSRLPRNSVALAASGDDETMLAEWLRAAGFNPVSADVLTPADADEVRATLVRWPCELSLTVLPGPIVLLYDPGADLSPVVGLVSEVLELPDSRDVRSLLTWSARLGELLRSVTGRLATDPPAPLPQEPADARADDAAAKAAPALIVVGISTGGPASLRTFFDGFERARDLPPIVVVQHIPPAYVDDLAQRLEDQTGYRVHRAADGEFLQHGAAVIAPGDRHLKVVPRGDRLAVRYDDGPPVRGHCPAVEVTFASCAELGRHGVAVMMTGMGRDGADSMRRLRDVGWATIGQDEATCTIYGMPRAARCVGAIQRELALPRIAPWLVAYCRRAMARV